MARTKLKLSKLLEKRGIENVEDLTPEEQATLERYKLILSGEAVTVDTLKAFCQNQIRIIEASCNGKEPLSMMQQACIHVYINLLKAIEAPEAERESLEKYLQQIITE